MRWLALFLVLVVTPIGCWDLAAGPGAESTGDAGAQCSQTAGCEACTSCALGGACADLLSTCQADSDCLSIDECFSDNDCGASASCQQACEANNPAGACDHAALWNCVQCEQCPTACGLCTPTM